MSQNNLILAGFMATGKTAVGRRLRDRTGQTLVDIDELVEQKAGRSIAAIFRDDGEPEFRRLETEAIERVAAGSNQIIATGGGAVLSEINRQMLLKSGTVVCLTARADTIAARTEASPHRPLLANADTRIEAITTLLSARQPIYNTLPFHVSTDTRDTEAVAEAVLQFAQLCETIAVPGARGISVQAPDSAYPILEGSGMLAHAGELLKTIGIPVGPVAIVTQRTIARHHSAPLLESLRAAGYGPALVDIPDGEVNKNASTVDELYSSFSQLGLHRQSVVIALGGGVVGDLAGFAAATYKRGMSFVQAPTSVLAMVDASVGGKTGYDLPQGKNLVGAFKTPEAVILDPASLRSLPKAEYRSGIAEMIKHGILANAQLLEALESGADPTALIVEAVKVKVDVVEADPHEMGIRMVLNLGHTFAHAFELESKYSMRHGDAVAVGLVAAASLGEALGKTDSALRPRIERILRRIGLPTTVEGMSRNRLVRAMSHDKKRGPGGLRFIVPIDVGRVEIVENPGIPAVEAALDAVLR